MSGFGAKWGESYAPSGILEVLYRGQIVYSRVFGKADRTTGAAPTPSTQFRIGSLTKQFTAAAILKLAEQGALKLDDPAKKYVTELPDAFKDVTLDQLLHQTSGIPAYTEDEALTKRKKEQIPEADILAWFGKQSPRFAAGTKWAYSNSNYYLLSVIAERAGKKPIDQLLKELVLDPAGMKATSPAASTGALALGYRRSANSALVPADVVSSSLPLGAGFLFSTAGDLALWDEALNGTKVLSDASKNKMWSIGLHNYGMGWMIDVSHKTAVAWHNGQIDGYSAYFARAPEKGVAVIFLSNVVDFDATKPGRDVLDMALGGAPIAPIVERDTVAMDEAFAKSLAGDYKLLPESEEALRKKGAPDALVNSVMGFSFAFADGGLTGKPSGQESLVFLRAPDGSVFNPAVGVDIVPDFGGAKAAKTLQMKQGELALSYTRGKYEKPKAKDKDPAAASAADPAKKAH